MNELPRTILVQLVKQHGTSIVKDPRLCKSLLNDALRNEHRKEISVLVHAVEGGIISDLLTQAEHLPLNVLIGRMAIRLRDEFGTGETEAGWAIRTWAVGLSLLSDDQPATHEGKGTGQQNIPKGYGTPTITPDIVTQDDIRGTVRRKWSLSRKEDEVISAMLKVVGVPATSDFLLYYRRLIHL